MEQLEIVNVSSFQVWLQWLVHVGRHAAISQVRVSLVPADGSGPRTAVLNSSVTEYTFRSVMTKKEKTQVQLQITSHANCTARLKLVAPSCFKSVNSLHSLRKIIIVIGPSSLLQPSSAVRNVIFMSSEHMNDHCFVFPYPTSI